MELYNTTGGETWLETTRWTKGIRKGLDPCDSPDYYQGISCSGQQLDPDRKVCSLIRPCWARSCAQQSAPSACTPLLKPGR